MSATSSGLAKRACAVEPFHVMRLLARARELEAAGRTVVHMEIGEPDFPTPGPIVEAGQRALAEGRTHYTAARGLPALRGAISEHYRRRFGVSVDPERILVTPGASGGLQLLLAALLDPGDAVLMADPGYPCNRHLVRLLGGVPRPLPVGPDTDYQLTVDHLDLADRSDLRVVMAASPANPTGTLLRGDELARLYAAVRERGGNLLVDEIYQGLVHDGTDQTALAYGTEGLFVVNSFSKYFGMTGWRLGWVVAPSACVDTLDRLAQNLFLAAPTPSQYAALSAFEPDTLATLEARRREFQRRRDFLLPALTDLGFRFPARPQGAFYLYARCDDLTEDSEDFAARLLEQEAVAVTPGRDFGANEPERHLRFAYTTGMDALREGVRRIALFLDDIRS
ncbi:MAG: pyridoxal phosphate-dependent aminotransferase [Pseudomonadota bacterium]|nr:pyridoxal phosphate-dependent aminotransferase [Pseudomonadota bacterium]